ncbi:MAG: hypothetical protein ACFFDF_09200 [Candidatus Odinarchaeota archaeon]
MDDHVTGIMYLDSEGLENQPVQSFLTKWTFNNKSCGMRKTKKNYDNIKYNVKRGKKILVCLSNHSLIEEFIERMEYKCDYIHLRGKLQPSMCNKENPNPNAYLNGGCYKCDEKPCLYKLQFERAKNCDLVFIVPQMLCYVETYEPDLLIIDESIESIVRKGIPIPPQIRPHVRFEEITCESCPVNDKCMKKNYRSKYPQLRCPYKMYFTIDFPTIEITDVNSLDEYFFKYNVENCREIYGIWDEEKNDYVILGYTPLDFLDGIETLIFNCATTTLSLAENIFGREFDAIIKDKEVMENPIYILDDSMTITKTEEALPFLVEIMDLFNIPKDGNTVIYCKKKFEADIKQLLPEVHTGHYGDCRGSNRFEESKNVILFGRFALRDSVKWLLSLYGLSSQDIKSMEEAEEIQALHRARPLLDRGVRIFLFTNTLIDKIPQATIVFNKRHLDKFLEILTRKEELERLSKTELYKEIQGDHNDVKISLEILEHFNKIRPIFGYGAKLEFV